MGTPAGRSRRRNRGPPSPPRLPPRPRTPRNPRNPLHPQFRPRAPLHPRWAATFRAAPGTPRRASEEAENSDGCETSCRPAQGVSPGHQERMPPPDPGRAVTPAGGSPLLWRLSSSMPAGLHRAGEDGRGHWPGIQAVSPFTHLAKP
ncbi:proline-rich protein HaeIII subfamily 1-like isoform X2 [Cavia porcellus]|uniref:proline-rich protein HaeIII subfamily 1-like isoform X2 n=1 Tax=Cavia porcellus TaxID=10141 RepID=UPI002FE25FAF